ncbi:aldose epimerase family protein [Liquorilactobacillus sicerae]|uniref:aldose epimerase family protein n=1 Tax=Liquorilactobacillus sicerae TaxID=1416943 RepID=UPI00247FB81B|nr:aldose epimerase family protein [Liquorilactobacillus sicerae]
MQIKKQQVATFQEQPVFQYRLINQQGNYIDVLSYGATWQSLVINGQNLLAHFDRVEDYFETPAYLCQTIGRVAGRISHGSFQLAGQTYQLPQNEGQNTLHGGPGGFAKWNWQTSAKKAEKAAEVILTKVFTPEMDGFLGKLSAQVAFSFDEQNQVKITFNGTSDGTTLFNPTNHAYFNLNADQHDLQDQFLTINSQRRLELDQEKLPTGEFLANQQTGYDFSEGQLLEPALAKINQQFGKAEIDDAFVVKANQQPIATLTNQKNGTQLELYSDRSGLVVFTADLNQDKIFDALALEAQSLPDAINHPQWNDDIVLADGAKKEYQIVFRYRQLKS